MEENKKALLNESFKPMDIIQQNATRDSFILYTEQKEVFKALSDEDAGILIKGIFDYISGQTPELNDLLNFVFIPIRQQLDRNAQKYETIKEKRRIAGAKGAKQKLANQANANFAKQSLANQADNVNDNVYVNDNDNDNVYLSKDKYIKEEEEEKNFFEKNNFENVPLNEMNAEAYKRESENWRGTYNNVHLTEEQYQKLQTMILSKEKTDKIINDFSENIASNQGKAKPYDEDFPDMHFIACKKYWEYRKQNPEKFKVKQEENKPYVYNPNL